MHDDLARLQGTWSLQPGTATITVKGDRFTTTRMGAEYRGKVVLDPTTTPKSFDLHFTAGPEKGNVNYGIYCWEGENWKICLATTGPDRPKAFTSVQIFSRGVAKELDLPASGPATELEGTWKMVTCVRDGEPLDKMLIKHGRRTVTGNRTVLYFGPEPYLTSTFTVDAAAKSIDLDHISGMLTGKSLGIYELGGNSMRMAYGAPGKPRPTDYSTAKGDGKTVTEWKRS